MAATTEDEKATAAGWVNDDAEELKMDAAAGLEKVVEMVRETSSPFRRSDLRRLRRRWRRRRR